MTTKYKKQAVFTPAEYTYVLLKGLFVVTVMVWYCGQPVGHGIERFIETFAVRIRPGYWLAFCHSLSGERVFTNH